MLLPRGAAPVPEGSTRKFGIYYRGNAGSQATVMGAKV
jgi:hypothetical protein